MVRRQTRRAVAGHTGAWHAQEVTAELTLGGAAPRAGFASLRAAVIYRVETIPASARVQPPAPGVSLHALVTAPFRGDRADYYEDSAFGANTKPCDDAAPTHSAE